MSNQPAKPTLLMVEHEGRAILHIFHDEPMDHTIAGPPKLSAK